jgi:hypothetical protein
LVAIAALAAGASGCTPLLMPPPVHLGETARVLQPGQVSLTAAGGYAFGDWGEGAGGSARVRAGIGYSQEVGVEATLANASASVNEVRMGGMVGGAKVSWKAGPARWFAVIAGAGFASSKTGNTLGADLAAVASPDWEHWQPYAGVRGTAVHRVSGEYPLRNEQVLTVPVGLSYAPSPRWRVFAEGGVSWFWSRDLQPYTLQPQSIGYLGAGGALTFR